MAKIDISPIRLTKDALVIWHEPTDEADMVADPRKLGFRPGSIDQIILNHTVDFLFADEAKQMLKSLRKQLKKGGKLYVLTDDFEYLTRAFVGGDISIELFNENHNHASQWDRESLGKVLIATGFLENDVKIWFESPQGILPRKHFELLIEATK